MNQRAYGFTIVELLIVIVVIAILATLSYVGYTGISQRANNASIINAASGSLRLLQAYIAEQGKYPVTSQTVMQRRCITTVSGCVDQIGNVWGNDPALSAAMSSVGTLPLSVPRSGDVSVGIIYQYTPTWEVDGVSRPAGVIYWLEGVGRDCGLPGVLANTDVETTFSSTGYTVRDQGGKTRCDITVPGPEHS